MLFRSEGARVASFVSSILALSGVEAIASLTGVLKLDPGATQEKPSVIREARRAILPVALEVVAGTILLGWATVSLWKWSHSAYSPEQTMVDRLTNDSSHVLRVLGEEFAAKAFGHGAGTACRSVISRKPSATSRNSAGHSGSCGALRGLPGGATKSHQASRRQTIASPRTTRAPTSWPMRRPRAVNAVGPRRRAAAG